MSRPVFLSDSLASTRLTLTGPEGRHAAAVRRLRVGEGVDVVDGAGGRAVCAVAAVGRDTVELEVLRREDEPEPALRIVLAQALAKGDRGELAVELATEVGVDEIVPWAAERCVARWEGERGQRALQRWRATAREAGKQSRRARLPHVTELVTTSALVERARRAAGAVVLHEGADAALVELSLPAEGDLLLVVGPEGGVSDRELEVLADAGATPARLGRTVLRASTAGAVAAAVVSASSGRWASTPP